MHKIKILNNQLFLDIVEEYYSPSKNAQDFILYLFCYRSKQIMIDFMNFIFERLRYYNTLPCETRENCNYEKYAALSVIYCLEGKLSKTNVSLIIIIQ